VISCQRVVRDDDDLEQLAQARVRTVLQEKYRLEAVLGIAGMGVVYRATHRNRARFARSRYCTPSSASARTSGHAFSARATRRTRSTIRASFAWWTTPSPRAAPPSYEAFLAMEAGAQDDPLEKDARSRLAALP
jgi:hypothetical protein